MPRRIEGENGDLLAEFHRRLPTIIEPEPHSDENGRPLSIIGLALDGKERDGIMDSMGGLNLLLQSLPPYSRKVLLQVIWGTVESTIRQGVPPMIIEIDRFGRPVERSRN